MFLKSSLQRSADVRTIRQQSLEDAMKNAVKTLLSQNARGALEDAAGLLALFVLMFAMLAVPGLS
jgi:hypothetical protein